ncbi:Small-subunit processome, Utp11 like protein [Aduncisulcus paluster]|uniref:U3 small nucleolar RNA-associated protein 11 n=1 Tax=Aduncisulcus paluster TaxID=2918883 RepID=A0ABQ5KRZ8_9EUKA|nr:Small-subunit processome, Utp11 like protein [Aduncisulcus paluster]
MGDRWSKVYRKTSRAERQQKSSRRRLGMLEKHGDYKKRSKHIREQKERITRLRRIAEAANPDEYNEKLMAKGTTMSGKLVIDNRKKEYSPEEIERLKKEDALAFRLKASKIGKEAEHIQSYLSRTSPTGNHYLFVKKGTIKNSQDAIRVACEHFDVPEELLGLTCASYITREKLRQKGTASAKDIKHAEKRAKLTISKIKQVASLKDQANYLEAMADIADQSSRLSKEKGRKRKVIGKNSYGKTMFQYTPERRK